MTRTKHELIPVTADQKKENVCESIPAAGCLCFLQSDFTFFFRDIPFYAVYSTPSWTGQA